MYIEMIQSSWSIACAERNVWVECRKDNHCGNTHMADEKAVMTQDGDNKHNGEAMVEN